MEARHFKSEVTIFGVLLLDLVGHIAVKRDREFNNINNMTDLVKKDEIIIIIMELQLKNKCSRGGSGGPGTVRPRGLMISSGTLAPLYTQPRQRMGLLPGSAA